MKVIATQAGFIYGKLRKEGDTFELKDVEFSKEKDAKGKPKVKKAADQFSSKWMEKA